MAPPTCLSFLELSLLTLKLSLSKALFLELSLSLEPFLAFSLEHSSELSLEPSFDPLLSSLSLTLS